MLVLRYGLLLAILVHSAGARGQDEAPATPPPRTVELEYAVLPGAEGCPDEALFKAMLRSDLGFDPFLDGAHARLAVTFAPAGHGRVRGYAELRDHTRMPHLVRFADPEECRFVASVLVVAIGIKMRVRFTEPVGAPAPAEPAPEPPSPVPEPPRRQPVEPEVSPTPARVQKPSAVHQPMDPEPRTPFRVGLEGGGMFVLWDGPHVAGQVLLGGVLRWRNVSLSVTGQFEPPTTTRTELDTPMSTARLAGSAAPCIHLGPFYSCPRIELGGLFIGSAASYIRFYSSAGGLAGLELSPRRNVGVRIFVAGSGPIVRPILTIRSVPIWSAPAASLYLGASIVVFP